LHAQLTRNHGVVVGYNTISVLMRRAAWLVVRCGAALDGCLRR
jgi:hypothetical protein